jgi:hypothetical protein
MKTSKEKNARGLLEIPWCVLLFVAYPTLALLARNFDTVSFSNALPLLVLSVVAAGIFLLLAWIWLRDWQRAALVTIILLLLFFTYGHVYNFLKGITVFGIYLFRHRILVPIWIVLAGLGIWWASRTKLDIRNSTRYLNITSFILLIFPAFEIGSILWKQVGFAQKPTVNLITSNASLSSGSQTFPDIYYIIPDDYSRSDKLKSFFGYDNSAFVESLKQMGFYVADCSASNYGQTDLSVSSELNLNYLSELGDTFTPTSVDRSPLWPLLKESVVRRFLEERGYKTIAFATGFSWSQWTDANLYLSPKLSNWQLDDFQYLWLQDTFARFLLDAEAGQMLKLPEDLDRKRILFTLDELPKLHTIQGPKFVFAHLIIPHPPYVFDPDGEPVSLGPNPTPTQGTQGYLDQVTYIDKRLLEVLPEIIAGSSTPPIIILQSDEGDGAFGGSDHMANLAAFYMPGHTSMLYPSISSVNTYRVILDEYFGQNLPLLPDASFESPSALPYNFHQVVNVCTR